MSNPVLNKHGFPQVIVASLVAMFAVGPVDRVYAKVLRSKTGAATVLVFKGADELRRLERTVIEIR
jgi:hypothetical protein